MRVEVCEIILLQVGQCNGIYQEASFEVPGSREACRLDSTCVLLSGTPDEPKDSTRSVQKEGPMAGKGDGECKMKSRRGLDNFPVDLG